MQERPARCERVRPREVSDDAAEAGTVVVAAGVVVAAVESQTDRKHLTPIVHFSGWDEGGS